MAVLALQGGRSASSGAGARAPGRAGGFGAKMAVGPIAATMLVSQLAEAATAGAEGFVALPNQIGVVSSKVLSDGSLQLVLKDGTKQIVAAGDFTVGSNGQILIAEHVAQQLIAAVEAVVGTGGLSLGAGAGLVGVAAAAGASGGGSERKGITGDTTGEVTEDAPQTTVSGRLSVQAADPAQPRFRAESSDGVDGSFTVQGDGSWSYALDNADPDTQALKADQKRTDSGRLTLTDEDGVPLPLSFQAATVPGVYGTFTMQADGSWTYTVDNTDPDTQALRPGQQATETLTLQNGVWVNSSNRPA